MPELPEVETIVNALRSRLAGKTVVDVMVLVPKLRHYLDVPALNSISGNLTVGVRRRAKYIIIEFADWRVMLIHLGMSGSLRMVPSARRVEKHEHLIWHLDDDFSLRFHDPRKFGMVEVLPLPAAGVLPEKLMILPPEPLDKAFSPSYFRRTCRERRRPIKSLLMDNRCVVGVGNIYASESLFRAGIRPTKAAGKLSQRQCLALVEAIKQILAEAIAAGGTTISDFVGLDGTEGRFARHLNVYGRAGKTCLACNKEIILKTVIGGRSTYYCPHCQK